MVIRRSTAQPTRQKLLRHKNGDKRPDNDSRKPFCKRLVHESFTARYHPNASKATIKNKSVLENSPAAESFPASHPATRIAAKPPISVPFINSPLLRFGVATARRIRICNCRKNYGRNIRCGAFVVITVNGCRIIGIGLPGNKRRLIQISR